MEYVDNEFIEEIKNVVNNFEEYLHSLGLELTEDGEIREINSKRLVLKIGEESE